MNTHDERDSAVEAVARALCDDAEARKITGQTLAPHFAAQATDVRDYWRRIARAAIAAMPATSAEAVWNDIDEANRECLAKRLPGEPMFIILGRDPDGAAIVRLWGERRRAAGGAEHGDTAIRISEEMANWKGKPRSAPDPSAYHPLYTHQAATCTGCDAAAKAEREAIVTWLRGDADKTEVEARRIVKNTTGNARRNAAEWDTLISLKRGLADAIERGDHTTKREA